jgi:NADPH-dependent 2,4-dienoyl-CoA reductase/sulfur reductase-like enzyme/nitrite reductase/ring-hydroxylating ferredoxin subunit
MSVDGLPIGAKQVVKARDTDVLLIHYDGGIVAVQPKCPHAGASLEKGAVCNGRLVCPWHLGTFALPGGELLEPPPMEALKTYPVRLDANDILVDPEPKPSVNVSMTQVADSPVFVLVGAGAAGTMAAVTLVEHGFSGRIVIVDPVPEEPVDRTQLSKDALGGKMPLEKVAIDKLNDARFDRLDVAVTTLSSANREIHLSDGSVMSFDKALIATGGRPKRLPIPGAERAYLIRHPADVQQVLDARKGKKETVIIGTSFIGLEAASALLEAGMNVTIVGKEELPFERQFGEQIAESLKRLHESKGTQFRLGAEVMEITPTAVKISLNSNEEEVPADLVIMGVGVTPELEFEHDLPVAKDGGIKTDSSLRAANTIWVAGDIASVSDTRIEHWRVAEQQGRVAALAMLGRNVAYDGVPFFWTYFFGKRLGYLGHAKEWDNIIIEGDIEKQHFIAFYVQDGYVHAILSCDYESEMAALSETMRGHLTVENALRTI